jgi:hypothetical protein
MQEKKGPEMPERARELQSLLSYLKAAGWREPHFRKVLSVKEMKIVDRYLRSLSYETVAEELKADPLMVHILLENIIAKLRLLKSIK